MKSVFFSMLIFMAPAVRAQTGQDTIDPAIHHETVTIIVNEIKDGSNLQNTKTYRLPDERFSSKNDLINHLMDSVNLDQHKDRRVTIISDGAGYKENKMKNLWVYHDFRKIQSNVDSILARIDHDIITPGASQFEYHIRPHIKAGMKNLNESTRQSFEYFKDTFPKDAFSPSTIQMLEVYPNNPANGSLNIKFKAPQKGNVSIVLTDPQGNEIGHEKLKDFQGDYMGQITLRKKLTGTIFVNVTQNNDGAVKRVVLK